MTSAERRIGDALGVLLGRRFRSGLYAGLTAGLSPGLSAATYPVISAIARFGPGSASSLTAQIGLERSVVSRRAMTLAEAGLLQVTEVPGDRRPVVFELTDAGRRAVEIMRARLDAAIAAHLDGWDTAEREALAALLSRFTESGELG